MSDREAEQRRRRATAQDHIWVLRERCVYCGTKDVRPRYFASGRTAYLDHFVPVEIVIRAREVPWLLRLQNFLLPCCPICNNLAGQYLFSSFCEKFDFVQWKLSVRAACLWSPFDNPQADFLQRIAVAPQLFSVIKIWNELDADNGYTILCPQRLRSGGWDASQNTERVLCSRQTPFTASSRMAS
jgi:hypothetical protein